MHTCSCGAVFESEEPHCRGWPQIVTPQELLTASAPNRDTHNMDRPLTPGRDCRRLAPDPILHHTRPVDHVDRLAFVGQQTAAPAAESDPVRSLWTAVVLLSGVTTLVAACVHYLS